MQYPIDVVALVGGPAVCWKGFADIKLVLMWMALAASSFSCHI